MNGRQQILTHKKKVLPYFIFVSRPSSIRMRGSVQTTFSQTLALISVIIFILSTIFICVCAYCFDFKKICYSIFYFLRHGGAKARQKYDYHHASQQDSHIFLNDHFTTETPLPSDEMPITWRNAVIMGTPPYRKFTTISSNFQGDAFQHNLSRQGSDKQRECTISAV